MITVEQALAGMEAAGWPSLYVTSQQRFVSGEEQWRRCLSGRVTPYDLNYFESQLPTLQENARRHAEFLKREAAEDAARDAPVPEWQRQESEQFLREANERAAHRASTEGRLEAIEKVLVEIRDALQRR